MGRSDVKGDAYELRSLEHYISFIAQLLSPFIIRDRF